MNIFTIFLVAPLANGLVLFYNIFAHNMGLAIIFFSLFLRVILSPLTRPYMDSMKKMRDYAKDIEKLKARHKDDKVKFMQAQSEFYKQKGINPSAGCLPYLLQIAVFFALFRVFSSVLSANGDAITKFNALLYAPLKFAEDAVLNTKFLYLDVTKPDTFSISGIPFAIPGLFVILAALTQLISTKMALPYLKAEEKAAKKTPSEADDLQVAMQSSMAYTFPLMTLIIGVRFPSGLALYWLLFSLFQVYQQYSSTGWGGLTPWLSRLNLIQLPNSNGKGK
jgi:YidC/Oxa1 family membrane protein insertase